MPRFGEGTTPCRIMIVGEAYGEAEERACAPFVGASGQELNRMLQEAGIMRSECYVTNVVNARPPRSDLSAWIADKKKDILPTHVPIRGRWVMPIVRDGIYRLYQELALVRPNIVIALGNVALWSLTGAWGVLKWRGSQLRVQALEGVSWEGEFPKLIPTIHPALILRQWEHRVSAVNDLKRVAKERAGLTYTNAPKWDFTLRPSYPTVIGILDALLLRMDAGESLWLDWDYETRAGHIACCGISWSRLEALCIPFMCVENKEGYWNIDEEAAIIHKIYKTLTHPNVSVRGQNLLYDCQYSYRHWHFVPRVIQDTMISHHTLFAGLPKRLDYQASLYCDHYLYWKDDGKTWNEGVGEDQLWSYNCVDCVRTREVGEVEQVSIAKMGLQPVEDFQQALFWPVLKAMQLGVRIDLKERNRMALSLQEEMAVREEYIRTVAGHALNPRSSTQLIKFFYEDLKIPPVITRAKKGVAAHVTCDDEALDKIKLKEPLTRPIVKAIREFRSIGVFLSTFVAAPLDQDQRMRCSYNICGTETYRFSSSKNAFGSGTNLQNIPKGGEEDGLELPNIRSLFIPDPGMTFFDMDLDRADLQVVVWEADDPELKAALRMGVDMHLLNAFTLAQRSLPPLEELVEGHAKYSSHRIPYKKERQLAKSFIHGSNYGGGARTMAVAAGVTVHQADRFQKIYFSRYPGIKKWHERTQDQLTRFRFVENKFGYRRYYFDRTDGLLPEALAWIPQSTVANYIDRVWLRIHENLPQIQVLLQVHDSLCGQFPTTLAEPCMRAMKEEARQVVVPYTDPLVIPVGIKTSEKSWGDC